MNLNSSDGLEGRYIDKSNATIVVVEEASDAQKLEFQRMISSEELSHHLSKQGLEGGPPELNILSIEYDDLFPERYDAGVFIAAVLQQDIDRVKILFAYENGETEIAWLQRHR